MSEEHIQGFLEIADGEAQRVEIQRLVEHQGHRQVVAPQHLPGAISIA